MNWWVVGGIFIIISIFYIIFPLGVCQYIIRKDNREGIPPGLQQIIRRFELRASSRQCGSHAILVLILGLLVSAAFVFVEAKAITTRETGASDLSQKLSQKTAQKDQDLSAQTRAKDTLNTAVQPIINMIGHEGPGSGGPTIELLDSRGYIKSAASIAAEISHNVPATNPPNFMIMVSGHRTNPSSGLSEPYQILVFSRTATPAEIAKLVNGSNLWEPKDISPLINEFDRLSHSVEIDMQALSRIEFDLNNYEIAKAAGEEPPAESGNLSLPFLLQLNITRFGTITLVSIAIGILVPLYRFSERLAAFYRARSDALRLHQMAGYKTVGIVRLSTMLTPNIDYGKTQNMPDNVVEMLRLVTHTEQEK